MTAAQVYTVARQAGFPRDTAIKMTAIARRESGWNPNAFNGNASTGDKSYGLWQINMLGALGTERRAVLGLSSDEQLFDPLTNARAAYWLWGGNDANLSRHWYINRTGPPYYYAEKYQEGLAAATEAANAVDGAGGTPTYPPGQTEPSGAPGWPEPGVLPGGGSFLPDDPDYRLLVFGALGALIIYSLVD